MNCSVATSVDILLDSTRSIIFFQDKISVEQVELSKMSTLVATEQFKATCHYCDKIYDSEESLKMHLTSHRIELNQ